MIGIGFGGTTARFPAVSVRSYGAIGDGVTDDTSAIQDAIDYLWDNHNTETFVRYDQDNIKNRMYGIVDLEAGKTYLISDTINIPQGIKIRGNGATIITDSAIEMLYFEGNQSGLYYAGYFGGIEDLLIDGRFVATRGINIRIINYNFFKNVHVHNCTNTGWLLQEVQYSTFIECTGQNNLIGAIVTSRPEDTDLVSIDNCFIGCRFGKNTLVGLWLQNSAHTAFYKCDIGRSPFCDILIGAGVNGYLTDYIVSDGGSGYPVDSLQPVTISGGTGTEARAFAQIDGSGIVTGVWSLDCGAAYTTGHTITVGGGGTGAVISCVPSTMNGISVYDGGPGQVRMGNNFYDLKIEHNADDIPASGYAIWNRDGRQNTFTNTSVQRQSAGTARPSNYFKYLRSDDFGIRWEGFSSDYVRVANPFNGVDISIFKSSKSGGLIIAARDYGHDGTQNKLAVSETDAAAGAKAPIICLGNDKARTAGFFESYSTSSTGIALKSGFDGEANERYRLYTNGEQRFGDGSAAPDVKITRGSAAPTSGAQARGSIVYNTAPAAAGTIGWVCVTAGTPGTWKTFGVIGA